jgi:hypothetical protein
MVLFRLVKGIAPLAAALRPQYRSDVVQHLDVVSKQVVHAANGVK